MNKSQLIDAISEKADINKKEAQAALEAITQSIEEVLS
ncbi:HU family DNA-binding protein, partial [Vibrio mediterranei]